MICDAQANVLSCSRAGGAAAAFASGTKYISVIYFIFARKLFQSAFEFVTNLSLFRVDL